MVGNIKRDVENNIIIKAILHSKLRNVKQNLKGDKY